MLNMWVESMLAFPNKKYEIIYADVPWWYNDRRKVRKDNKKPTCGIGACIHYPLMKTKDVCKLPVGDIADRDCALLLWSTTPCLDDAMQVIKAWGFKYVNFGFIWIKINKNSGTPFFGVGTYTKSNCEPCLLAKKGKIKQLVVSNTVSQVIISPREEHSKKPDEARNKIVQLFGNKKRIELFARQKIEGWDSWGNEV
jgi:N6-adenosine-specific RNA methylase IME4